MVLLVQPGWSPHHPVSCRQQAQHSMLDSKDLPKGSNHEDGLRIPWLQDLEHPERISCQPGALSPEGLMPGAGDQNMVNNGNFSSM